MLKALIQSKVFVVIVAISLVMIAVYGFFIHTEIGNEIYDDIFGDDTVEGNSPRGVMTIFLTEADNPDHVFTGTIDIEELSIFREPQPLTSFTQDVFGIDVTKDYYLNFIVEITVSPEVTFPEQATESLEGTIHMVGNTSGVIEVNTIPVNVYTNHILETNLSDVQSMNFDTPATFTIPQFVYLGSSDHPEVVHQPIRGLAIDGSQFNLTIFVRDVATGGGTYYGFTTAKLILNVDVDGNIMVDIIDVIGTATEE